MLFYSKKIDDGSTIYIEDILNSKKNKALRSKTLFKKKNDVDEKTLLEIASGNVKTDISKIKTVDLHRIGDKPDIEPIMEIDSGCHSASRADQRSDNNITQPDPVVNRKIDRLNTLLSGEKQRKRGSYERSF